MLLSAAVVLLPSLAQKLTNLFNMAYKMARRKPEAKEYVERLIKVSMNNQVRGAHPLVMRNGRARSE